MYILLLTALCCICASCNAQLLTSSSCVAWYIPPSWKLDETPHNITHAARLAARCANQHPEKYLAHTKIPRIIHQSWKSTRIRRFPVKTLRDVEGWLEYATDPDGPELAYFMWDDAGVADLVQESDPDLFEAVDLLSAPVEKADIFRVLVCNEIGGVVSYQAAHEANLLPDRL